MTGEAAPRTDRGAAALRPIRVTPGWNRHAEGSALVEWGDTKVQATVSIEARLPPHLRNAKGPQPGWLTAEYALLPRATHDRSQRERLYASGRTQEIQRLIGRALRSTVDLELFRNRTVIVDVDVLQADGGTRCAGIVAGYAALFHAANRLVASGEIDEWPLRHEIAAVSVGIVGGTRLVDLEYREDAAAEVDLNVVGTADGQVVEVQGGGEHGPVDAETYVQLVASGLDAVARTLHAVRPQLR